MDGGDGSEPGTRREDRGEWNRLAQRHSPSLPASSWAHVELCTLRAFQTCAHRYQRRLYVTTSQESRDITGRCYVLSQNLTINEASEEDGGNWNFCEGRGRGHERFGSCQQGLAATFTKDYHYVVFGAPGAYNWKGTSGRSAARCFPVPDSMCFEHLFSHLLCRHGTSGATEQDSGGHGDVRRRPLRGRRRASLGPGPGACACQQLPR